jgi:hypothetical protein
MPPINKLDFIMLIILIIVSISVSQDRPSLFFREDWQETPAALPITQEHVANENLILHLLGPGKNIKKSHHDKPADDPFYVWSGECSGNWAVALEHKKACVDLTGQAKIKWRSKQSGLRRLHIILKLPDGSWIVSDQYENASKDWRVREFNVSDIKWYKLDIENIVEGKPVDNPDLGTVEQIGFTDLMRGGKSHACSRVDWIEVYGRQVEKGK